MAAKPQIIVIKKKSGHGGHHGGAWKVAYADFVTAMMALFIVLWLMNSNKPVQEAISGYFKDPMGTGSLKGSTKEGTGKSVTITKENMDQLKQDMEKAIQKMADFEKLKSQIEVTVTEEGLRIEMMESKTGTFFESGRPEASPDGRELLMTLAEQIGKLPNRVSIEGHTDSQPFTGPVNYTNWELSADRANASRRLMQEHGLRVNQVAQVRGFADQQPRKNTDPSEPSNRRISLIVQYLDPKDKNTVPNLPATAPENKTATAPAGGKDATR
jgi:chemotaxis protein MotB